MFLDSYLFPSHSSYSPLHACMLTQSFPTLCDPIDCSLSDSSVHGIFQAKILEWVAIFFSRRFPGHRDWTMSPALAGILYHWTTWEACIKPWKLVICSLFMYDCYFKNDIEIESHYIKPFGIGFFTQHNSLEIHPGHCVWQQSISFYYCIFPAMEVFQSV